MVPHAALLVKRLIGKKQKGAGATAPDSCHYAFLECAPVVGFSEATEKSVVQVYVYVRGVRRFFTGLDERPDGRAECEPESVIVADASLGFRVDMRSVEDASVVCRRWWEPRRDVVQSVLDGGGAATEDPDASPDPGLSHGAEVERTVVRGSFCTVRCCRSSADWIRWNPVGSGDEEARSEDGLLASTAVDVGSELREELSDNSVEEVLAPDDSGEVLVREVLGRLIDRDISNFRDEVSVVRDVDLDFQPRDEFCVGFRPHFESESG